MACGPIDCKGLKKCEPSNDALWVRQGCGPRSFEIRGRLVRVERVMDVRFRDWLGGVARNQNIDPDDPESIRGIRPKAPRPRGKELSVESLAKLITARRQATDEAINRAIRYAILGSAGAIAVAVGLVDFLTTTAFGELRSTAQLQILMGTAALLAFLAGFAASVLVFIWKAAYEAFSHGRWVKLPWPAFALLVLSGLGLMVGLGFSFVALAIVVGP